MSAAFTAQVFLVYVCMYISGDALEERLQSHSVSISSLVTPPSAAGMASGMELPRKRKGSTDNKSIMHAFTSVFSHSDTFFALRSEGDDQHVKIKCFREPHSQIEKRRRDKMNNLIDELSAMIPTCNPMSRKLDKLTVLRMAVQHLKSLKVCNYSKSPELIGQSLFDFVHPKDIGKVKEQLSASELYPRERLIDAKTGMQVQADLPVGAARLCSGARRSFFCRMKYNKVTVKEEKDFQAGSSKKKESQRYCTVHCTGYMRTWPTSQLGTEGEAESEKDSSHFSCLVAIGRVHPHTVPQANGEVKVKPTEFVTRCAMDGKFTFVDQRATTILGYLPQELLGTSCYEYFHQDDLPHLADRHRKVLRSKEKIETNCYKFKTKYGSFVTLQSQWFSFINPWTKEVEYIVSTNTVMSGKNNPGGSGDKSEQPVESKASEDDGKKSLPIIPGISNASGTMIYAGSIGTQIANELLDFNRINSSPSSGNASPFSLLQDKSPLALTQASSNVPNGEATDVEIPGKSSSEDDARSGPFAAGENPLAEGGSQLDLEGVPGLGSLSSDEAAMAVIMSLLETDANLGEAVDFDEMHWSL
uniref:Aryl hydrocarbon receptor nuclear translocator-like 2 n=1 Tax=Astyanax mexicanus TaxID=7994 RepID=A0A8B9LD59_ASTMX